jgi:hypothetical protein
MTRPRPAERVSRMAGREVPSEVAVLRAAEIMRIDGAIMPVGGGKGFSREAWRRLIGSRPELQRPASKQTRNPFTGEAMTVDPPEDAAEVMLEGRVVGEAYWSLSDDPLVNVSVDLAVIFLVTEWAAALGGEFHLDSADV